MTSHSDTQRIARLTPLRTILALIETSVGPVKPETTPVSAAFGSTLADDVVVPSPVPSGPLALRDGFAVNAAAIADAGSYTPVLLVAPSVRIDAGEAMPAGTDAVVPFDAVNFSNGRAEAVTPIASGEGVLAAGGDANAGTTWRQAGQKIRAVDAAILTAAGRAEINARRPRVRVVSAAASRAPIIDASLGLVARAAVKAGGRLADADANQKSLEEVLTETGSDVVMAIGGTGSGQRDTAVKMLARLGRVEAHGIAVSPGETAAFGFAGGRPVLLMPGRLDAALALWLLIGRPLLARLAGGTIDDVPVTLPLKRKVASTIGLTEVVPVRCSEGMAEPLGSGYLSLTSIARSDGWIAVPADSEGFAAGSPVAVYPWP